jgi:hypothetical protein
VAVALFETFETLSTNTGRPENSAEETENIIVITSRYTLYIIV